MGAITERFVCAGCGAEFERDVYPSTRPRFRAFCSRPCARGAGCKPRRGSTRPCVVCASPFYAAPAEKRRFCSKECSDQAQRARRRQDPCAGCGRPLDVRASDPRRYCTRACWLAHVDTGSGRSHNGRPVRKEKSGYLLVFEPDHPNAQPTTGYLLEHRLVASKVLGRPLADGEVVHHLNGRKWDNRPENLEVMDHGDHSRLTGLERTAAREALVAELDEYRRRFGPLP